MPKVYFDRIHCKSTEDWGGTDEVYIMVDGERIWGPQSLNDGDSASVNVRRDKGKKIHVELWDQDMGGPDNDDNLGGHVAYPKKGKEYAWKFTRHGANYTLYANVDD